MLKLFELKNITNSIYIAGYIFMMPKLFKIITKTIIFGIRINKIEPFINS